MPKEFLQRKRTSLVWISLVCLYNVKFIISKLLINREHCALLYTNNETGKFMHTLKHSHQYTYYLSKQSQNERNTNINDM